MVKENGPDWGDTSRDAEMSPLKTRRKPSTEQAGAASGETTVAPTSEPWNYQDWLDGKYAPEGQSESDALRMGLWRQLLQVANEARRVGSQEPKYGTLVHLLNFALWALSEDKLSSLDVLRPEMEKLNAKVTRELFAASGQLSTPVSKMDGPSRADRVKRMTLAAQRWIDNPGLDAEVGICWVAGEALPLFDGPIRESLEALSLVYESRDIPGYGEWTPEKPELLVKTAVMWTEKRQAESHDYVSIVLRAAGVSSEEVNRLFTNRRVTAKRAAVKRKGQKQP